ncbi:MAG: Uma2 family endonuclease [Planctomycetota bacterium]
MQGKRWCAMSESLAAPSRTAPRRRLVPRARALPADVSHGVVLNNIPWKIYRMMVKAFNGRNVYLTYDRGALEIMTKSGMHEGGKKLLARLLELLSLEWDVPIAGFGEMTWSREDLECGLEPDECYYVKNEPQMGRATNPDPRRDPSPDLVIEIEFSRRLLNRQSILAAMGVPELWCFDGRTLRFLVLDKSGRYERHDESISFPGLRSSDIERFLLLRGKKSEHEIVRAFRDWARAKRPQS